MGEPGASRYGDPERFANERERIFEKDWIFVGRVEDFAERGAWANVPLTRAGVVVVNDGSALRAFHTVCPHRGAAFLDPGEGRAERFVCPYHGFGFELDGRACANTADLAPVRLETHLGFVFVTLSADARPLVDALGELPPWLERADLSALRRVRRLAYDVAADWKLVVENFQESLHFPTVHPALEALTPSAKADTWLPRQPSAWLGGLMPIVDGAETVSTSRSRGDRAWLVPEEDRRLVHDAMAFPNLLTSVQPDYLLTFALFPIDAARTHVVASTYVHRDAKDVDDVLRFWSKVYDEDREACERQHRGAVSLATPPAYTDVEEGAERFAAMVEARAFPGKTARHCGVLGRPFLDLSEHLDTSAFAEIHDEITRGLVDVESDYTGGSLKWMGVCAPWVETDPYRDYMEVVRSLPREELELLLALGDPDVDRARFDLDRPETIAIGDETDHPLTRAQMRFLELRHGVYFPWKVCYHFLENERWEDKHSGAGKTFSDEAREVFPKTVAFIESLPFTEIGRAVLFGVMPNDHAPAHRDTEPGKALAIAQSISFEPSRGSIVAGHRHKRFFLLAPDGSNEVVVDAPIYWFNDMDWHGVHADPWFRYSIRVDGVFDRAFLSKISARTRETRGRRP